MKRLLMAVLAAVALTTTVLTPAVAISYGDPAPDHDEVGLILFYADDGAGGVARYRCSATLIEPDVLLTAAHCTEDLHGPVLVSFEDDLTGMIPAPAADPTVGYTEAEIPAGWLTGTGYAHPDFSHKLQPRILLDMGLVLLDEPTTHASPAELAPEGYLDGFRAWELKSMTWTAVGYGIHAVHDEAPARGAPYFVTAPIERQQAIVPFGSIVGETILSSANWNDARGQGGTCFGDSGGALFVGDYLIGDTSFGGGAFCNALTGYQRTDTAEAYRWRAEILSMP
jgi:hypothetical protein